MPLGQLTDKGKIRQAFEDTSTAAESARIPRNAKIMDLEDAIRLFDIWADREDLANHLLHEGCHARTHILCRELQAQGYSPQKAWAIRDANGEGFIKLGMFGDRTPMNGEYHTSPVIPVRAPDGRVQNLIFDPVLADGPMTDREWRGAVGLNPDGDYLQFKIVDFGKSPFRYTGDYRPLNQVYTTADTDTQARVELDSFLKNNPDTGVVGDIRLQRVVFPSAARQEAALAFPENNIPMAGSTWISGSLILSAPAAGQDMKASLTQKLGAKIKGLFR